MEQSSGGADPQVSRDERLRVAVLFDAEGSVCLYDGKRHGAERYALLDIAMSDGPTMLWYSDVVARAGVRHYYQTEPPRHEGRKPMFKIRIQSLRTVRRFYDVFGEFLMTKADEMRIMMEYVDFALSQIHAVPDRLVQPGGIAISKSKANTAARATMFEECQGKLAALRAAHLRDYTRYSRQVVQAAR